MNTPDTTSTRPYLIRALYEWCTDNGLTPYVAVAVDETVQVPREYVKNNEIVLNISFDATSSLKLSNDFIEFKARFAGSSREIMVPIARVIAIYARENGQGMSFPMGASGSAETDEKPDDVQTTLSKPFSVVGESAAERSEANKVVHLVLEEAGTTAERDAENTDQPDSDKSAKPDDSPDPPHPPSPQKSGRPALKRVK